jgi:adenylate cyclase
MNTNTEIERKFLVRQNWPKPEQGARCIQGYLSLDPDRIVRVRLMNGKATLTIKALKTALTRHEYEYDIPVTDAEFLLHNVCLQPLIDKTRYQVFFHGFRWEIDEFHGLNSGLILAEVELTAEGQAIKVPPWVDEEVTNDPRYYNANLVTQPFTTWAKRPRS